MEEALNYLNSLMNASEASIVHQFSVWLGPHEVRVEVKDRGEKAAGPTRF